MIFSCKITPMDSCSHQIALERQNFAFVPISLEKFLPTPMFASALLNTFGCTLYSELLCISHDIVHDCWGKQFTHCLC